MSGLDAIYAMLAHPVKATLERRRRVKQLDNDTTIGQDSHEPPQSQLPPSADQKSDMSAPNTAKQSARESVNKPIVERRARRTGSNIDIEV